MDEIWLPVVGWEDKYTVSNQGKVRSVKSGKLRSITLDENGYPRVSLYRPNTVKTVKVHKIMSIAFFGHSDLHVNHINGIKTDNRIENLENVSVRENNNHKTKSGLNRLKGTKPNRSGKTWSAQIEVDGKAKIIGCFPSEQEAHETYVNYVSNMNQGKYAMGKAQNDR